MDIVLTVNLRSRRFDDQLLISDGNVEPLLHFSDIIEPVEDSRVWKRGQVKEGFYRFV